VWGSPPVRVTVEYPLNLWGASSPTLVEMAPVCVCQGTPYRTAQKLFNVPPCARTVCPRGAQAKATIRHLTVGVEPTPRGWGKGDGDDAVWGIL